MDELGAAFRRRIVDTFAGGAEWLVALPGLIKACEGRWGLRAGAPFANLSYNYVARATRADGSPAVLKLGVARAELRTEIDALVLYNGRGAVRLLASDAAMGALLLEEVRPGALLSALADDDAATLAAAEVMERIWRLPPAKHAFPSVADWAAGLAELRPRFGGGCGPFPPALVDRAEGLFGELLPSQGAAVVLHGDLHHYNILTAERASWLAIDPKGVIGEPAYELGALLRNPLDLSSWPDLRRTLRRRIDLFCDRLALDRRRVSNWALAQAVLSSWWSYDEEGPESAWRRCLIVAEALG